MSVGDWAMWVTAGFAALGVLFGGWRYWHSGLNSLDAKIGKEVDKLEVKIAGCVPRPEHEGVVASLKALDTKIETIRDQAVKVQVVDVKVDNLGKQVDRIINFLEKHNSGPAA